MKNAKVGSKKILKAAQPRRVAGVPVRSGVKAGLGSPRRGGESEFGRGGRGTDIPGRLG
jgi:hypothetical protein